MQEHTGDKCRNCGTSYRTCTDMVFIQLKSCCSDCHRNETHNEVTITPKPKKKMSLWWWLTLEYHVQATPGHSNTRSSKDCYDCRVIYELVRKAAPIKQ
jgi:hypothetical protein